MTKYITNPFETTKAVDLTNEQINDLWVDLLETQKGFHDLIKPTSFMPMFFLGGKGSGRTHILKYFSYELQKIRFGNKIIDGLIADGYLGIFFRLGTLAESRFSGMGINKLKWEKCFHYFMDLSVAYKTLTIFNSIYKDADICIDNDLISKEISNLFDSKGEMFNGLPLESIIAKIDSLRKDIDYKINNAPFSKELDIEILTTEGRLVFQLAKILTKYLNISSDIKILYLFDELENISFQHQKYIQNLVRLRESPVALKFSGRLYAVNTTKTLCHTGEGDGTQLENYRNSEYEEIHLDQILRECTNYPLFIKNICMKRIKKSFPHTAYSKIEDTLEAPSTEETSLDRFGTGVLSFLVKDKKRERKYFSNLKDKMEKCHFTKRTIEQIIENFEYQAYPLVEKTSIFLFYQFWSKGKTDNELIEVSKDIKQSADNYISDEHDNLSKHFNVLQHYKKDLIDQIYREHNQNFYYQYTGIDNFIVMSCGIPRSVLSILKETYKISQFSNEKPFMDDHKISKQSQYDGVKAAARIFFETASDNKSDPQKIKDAIKNLATLFAEIRYSDKPTECSPLSFSTDITSLSEDAKNNIYRAVKMSLLIELNDRKDKNSEMINPQYKLSPFLSVLWRLPLASRGCVPIASELANSIFDPNAESQYTKLKQERIRLMTVPYIEDNDIGLGI